MAPLAGFRLEEVALAGHTRQEAEQGQGEDGYYRDQLTHSPRAVAFSSKYTGQ